jgi:hypothetical protein
MSNDPRTLTPEQDQPARMLSERTHIGVAELAREGLPAEPHSGDESEAFDIDWRYRADRRRKALAQHGQ